MDRVRYKTLKDAEDAANDYIEENKELRKALLEANSSRKSSGFWERLARFLIAEVLQNGNK